MPENPTQETDFGGSHFALYSVYNYLDNTKEFVKSKQHNGVTGRIASVSSLELSNHLANWLAGTGKAVEFWHDISDVEEEGVWKDSKGKVITFTQWAKGEPDNSLRGEHCATATLTSVDGNNSLEWRDVGCNSVKSMVLVQFDPAVEEAKDL
eukprot:TRINITY_DN77_c0_g1_i1.p1 TRINITY_DN77_c0_g1~~TRINITY_DN77_c0_g1_i1.p1  ORF type:complete len:152 (+),score=36.80 TRINITY_DN77_c0_g1_i1:532-987(+)